MDEARGNDSIPSRDPGGVSPGQPAPFFRYLHSCDLHLPVQVKICQLEGSLPRLNYEHLLADPILKFSGRNTAKFPDLVVEAVLADGASGRRLHVPVFTAYKHFTRRWEWNQWLTLPLNYSDLPRSAQLCLTLYDCSGPPDRRHPVGGTTLLLFGGRSGQFRHGPVDLRVWNDTPADSSDPTSTPGQISSHTFSSDQKQSNQLERLTHLSKKHRAGKIPPIDWLDRLSFAEVERISQREKHSTQLLFLMVEFSQFRYSGNIHSLVYFEKHGEKSNVDALLPPTTKWDLIRCPDFDVLEDNLVEAKHHRLARSTRAGQTDKDLKPNAEIRNRLNDILGYPSTQSMSLEESDLIWRFRFYLSSNKKALAKFVKCVNWTAEPEATQALAMVNKWSPMDVEDALELLGPNFKHAGLRRYAVQRLQQAPDADLLLYLLQLVQALKYEKLDWLVSAEPVDGGIMEVSTVSSSSGLGGEVEGDAAVDSGKNASDLRRLLSDNSGTLAAFLIERASHNSAIASYFYWYMVVECEEPDDASLSDEKRWHGKYKQVLRAFLDTLRHGPSAEMRERGAMLRQQHVFIDKLVLLIKAVAREPGALKRKIDKLQTLLSDPEAFRFNFVNFDTPMELPLDPNVRVCGILPQEASIFKSSLMPSRLSFRTTDANGTPYVALFKHGDDLRQDQLVLQIITLMDRILQQENLDLCLTPYRVLATSTKHGFVQFVNAVPIFDILRTDGTIHNFFKKHHPSDSGPYGISHEVMDTYVRSCAGYCVITYLLGVGDRHHENLMLSRSGHLMHIDFGYILGRDPKPMPPPMKLSKEMIEAFGGVGSEHYQEFKKQCYTSYLSLRRHSNLILNLFSLMVDTSVPDIALEPDKIVLKVQDKFRLDLSDEEAVGFMQNVIDISATAVMAAIVERLHKLAQFMRN